MRLTALALLGFALFPSPPAAAQVLDVSTIKCEDFFKNDTASLGVMLMWLNGYYASENEETTINFEEMKATGEKLARYCVENPTIGVLNAAEKVMSK